MSLTQEIHAMYLNGNLGIKVPRIAALDVAGWVPIYTIAGGFVQVTGLYAVVTVLHAGALCQVQFRHSVGGTVLNVLTNAVASPVGTLVTITGDPADPAIIGVGTGVLDTAPHIQGGMKGSGGGVQQMGRVMGAGTIDVDWTVVTAGQTRYILTYIPLDPNAYVYAN
jgi:hypothetical protein